MASKLSLDSPRAASSSATGSNMLLRRRVLRFDFYCPGDFPFVQLSFRTLVMRNSWRLAQFGLGCVISGGHVEYEQNRWLEAFGLSLRDVLTKSPRNSSITPVSAYGSHLVDTHEALANLFTSLFR